MHSHSNVDDACNSWMSRDTFSLRNRAYMSGKPTPLKMKANPFIYVMPRKNDMSQVKQNNFNKQPKNLYILASVMGAK